MLLVLLIGHMGMDNKQIQRFQELKQQVEQYQREHDRLVGTLDALKARLKEEFGRQTLKEAKILLAQMEGELESQVQQMTKEMEEFEEKYGDLLDRQA